VSSAYIGMLHPPALTSAACSSGSLTSIPDHTSLLRPSSSAASSFSASLCMKQQQQVGRSYPSRSLFLASANCACPSELLRGQQGRHLREPLGCSPGVVLDMLQKLGIEAHCVYIIHADHYHAEVTASQVCFQQARVLLVQLQVAPANPPYPPILTCPAWRDRTCLHQECKVSDMLTSGSLPVGVMYTPISMSCGIQQLCTMSVLHRRLMPPLTCTRGQRCGC
jgi:hypothetical protein